jgi:hypothetical protein
MNKFALLSQYFHQSANKTPFFTNDLQMLIIPCPKYSRHEEEASKFYQRDSGT